MGFYNMISHRLAPVSRPLLKLLQISQNTICSAIKVEILSAIPTD